LNTTSSAVNGLPLHALLELPDDGFAVLGEAAVLEVRNLGGEERIEGAIGIPARQRLVEDARAVLVLGPDREVRIEQRRTLPPEDFQRPAATALGRLVLEFGLRPGDARIGQHLRRQRPGQSDSDHSLHKIAAREFTGLNVADQTPQCMLVHRPLRMPAVDCANCCSGL
jgi:hypothetical protein